MSFKRPDSPLGPQCLRCRRRRVKCDSAPETCQRCPRDGYECPGYEEKTKWKVVTQEAMQNPKRRKRGAARQNSLATSSSSNTANDSSRSTSPAPNHAVRDLKMPSPLILSTIEKEILEIQSAIVYYNESLVPDLAASPIPSETISIPLDVWLEKSPKVLHHIIVTIVTCHRLACNGSTHGMPNGKDESQLADTLNRHRGRALLQLQRILSNFWHGSGEDGLRLDDSQYRKKGLVTLVAVVMLLAQEVQMSATSLWSMHLEAARSLVIQLGGYESFWSRQPLYQGLFMLYIMIDLLSPPTSSSATINEAQQRSYSTALSKLEHFERRTIASFQPCPLAVLQAILQTNVLRAAIHRRTYDTEALPYDEAPHQAFALTLASLLRFDPAAWGREVVTTYLELSRPRPKADPEAAAWAAFGSSFQSAAIIYLIRSVRHTSFARSMTYGSDVEGLLKEHRTKLSSALAFICRDLTRNKAGALWRFVSWPLVAHAYELVGWTPVSIDCPSATENGSDTTIAKSNTPEPPKEVSIALRRLSKVARRLGANSLFEGVELMEGVWRQRCYQHAGLGGATAVPWSWDDAFPGRCVFIV